MTRVAYAAATSERRRRRFPLWIPLLLVWLIALPFVLLLAPVVFIACLVFQVNPLRGVALYWQIFSALRGVRVEVDAPAAPISFRIF
jgi:hypothetical protein